MPLTPNERGEILDAAKIAATTQAVGCAECILQGHIKRGAKIGLGVLLGALLIGGAAWSQLRPKYTPPARERATAKCADGTYSFAFSRQGACSGHGGVKVFYK